MRAYLSRLTTIQINNLKSGLDNAFYWLHDDAVIQFLSQLGRKDEDVVAATFELLKRRNDDA